MLETCLIYVAEYGIFIFEHVEKISAEAIGVTGGCLKQWVISHEHSPGPYGSSELSVLYSSSRGLCGVKKVGDDQTVLSGSKITIQEERPLLSIDKILQ